MAGGKRNPHEEKGADIATVSADTRCICLGMCKEFIILLFLMPYWQIR